MDDLQQAKARLAAGDVCCVVCRNGETYTSAQRGVAPLLNWLDDGAAFDGASAADKVVGKAAAMLFVLLGLKAVYTPVISQTALAVFEQHGVAASWDRVVPYIINRAGTGPCPMEQAVSAIDAPAQAPQALRAALQAIKQK